MYIASVSSTIKFHEFPNGNVVHNYQPGKVEGPIRSISWSRDGNWLTVVPHSGHTEIVSTKDKLKLLKTIYEVDEPTCACFQKTTKKHLGIGTKNGLALIYDIKSRNVKKRFPRASSQVTHLVFTSKDTHCITGYKNGDILIYNNVTNSPPSNLRVPKSNSVTCLQTNMIKRNLVLGGSNEGIVVVWDININRSKFCVEAHKSSVNCLAFSPGNSDLIITAGGDKQFCFYDIADNKCIANIAVENSITSVDFSPDGTYFAMASQNGRVYVYDSRNIQEPVHSFIAHKTPIRHIAFQNLQESNNSSMCSLSSESLLNSTSSADGTPKKIKDSSSDLFGMYIPTPLNRGNSVPSMEENTFIAAPCFNKNNDILFIEGNRLPNINLNESEKLEPKQCASVPKLNSQNRSNMELNRIPTTELKSLIKECFNEEFKTLITDLKNDIKYQATHTTYQLRAMLLDLQMAMVKEFIKLENFNERIREEVYPNINYTNLLEENEKLRRQNQLLEEQFADLKAKQEDYNL